MEAAAQAARRWVAAHRDRNGDVADLRAVALAVQAVAGAGHTTRTAARRQLRRAVECARLEGRTWAEIADVIGVNLSVVRRRLSELTRA